MVLVQDTAQEAISYETTNVLVGVVMNEKCCKCLVPYRAIYCDCAYVDLFGCCAASKEQRDYCKFCVNEEKNYMRCKYE